jgi:hypothetical protein
MKRVAAVVLLVAVSASVIYVEYEMTMWLGPGLLLIAGFGLTVIGVALYRAPQECDSRGAFYIRRSPRLATHIPHHRFSQLIRVRL